VSVHVQTGNMLDVIVDGNRLGLQPRGERTALGFDRVFWLSDPESLMLVLEAELYRLAGKAPSQQSSGEVLVSKSAVEGVKKLVDEWGAMAEQFWKEGDRGNAATRQGWICGARVTLKALGLTEADEQ